MDVLNELEKDDEELNPGRIKSQSKTNWINACVCGHLETLHSASIGGTMPGPEFAADGELDTDGCRGAFANRGEPAAVVVESGKWKKPATCPCEKFHGVARTDRAHTAFRQKVSAQREHPFTLGIRAFHTWLSKRKGIGEEKAAAELDKRFRWIEEERKCEVCGRMGGGVWPRFVDDRQRSELRCKEHWNKPYNV